VAELTHDLRWSAGAGMVSAKFDTFTDPVSGANYDGKTINFVPAYTIDSSLLWQPGQHLFCQAGGQVVGAFWYDEANT
jgi:hypothetical protein